MANALDQIQKYSNQASVSIKNAVNQVATDVKAGVKNIENFFNKKSGALSLDTGFPANDIGKLPQRVADNSPNSKTGYSGFKGTLSFPANLPRYISFSFKKYNKLSALQQSSYLPEETITLPMPAQLSEAFNATYNTPSLGPLLGTGTNVTRDLMDEGSRSGGATQSGSGAFEAALQAVAAAGAKKILGGQEDSKYQAASVVSGIATNPNLAVMFSQMELREHRFEYTLAAHSSQELQTIKSIVRSFKMHMLPSYAGTATVNFLYPDLCDIEFGPNKLPFAFKRCVLQSVTFDYAPEGVAFFRTGDPVMVKLTLNFKETEVWTQEDLIDNTDSGDPSFRPENM